MLVCNLTDHPLEIGPKNPVAYVHLVDIESLASVSPFGMLSDLGLEDDIAVLSLPNIGPGLSRSEQLSVEELLTSFADLFSEGPHDFGLMKGTTHQLQLDQTTPFRTAPY